MRNVKIREGPEKSADPIMSYKIDSDDDTTLRVPDCEYLMGTLSSLPFPFFSL